MIVNLGAPAVAVSRRVAPSETANAITHGLGLLLSLVGASFLIPEASALGPRRLAIGCWLYCLTQAGVFAASFLSHAAPDRPLKRILRAYDQAFIYLYIAGSFTPFGLVHFWTPRWQWLMTVIWGIAVAGFLSKTVLFRRIDCVSLPIYLLLGWLPIIGLIDLGSRLEPACLGWIFAGGFAYTAGITFFLQDHRHKYFHAVWHLFVILGSLCHYHVIWKYAVHAAG